MVSPEPDPAGKKVEGSLGQISLLTPVERDALRLRGQAWSQDPGRSLEGPIIDPDLEAHGHGVIGGESVDFTKISTGYLEATKHADQSIGGMGKGIAKVQRIVLGVPLSNLQSLEQRLTKIKALAVLSSDALSSVAYATEQILTVLALAGVAALTQSIPIMGAIVLLLGFVVLSYRQTIKAYPKGGGSYIVAKDNLGAVPGLIAGAALMTDYILTVAVSVASGVDQLQSAFPAIVGLRVQICVLLIVLIMLGNLRGIRQAGSIFAAPTYLFIGCMLLMLGTLLIRELTGTLLPVNEVAAVKGVEGLTLFLILRAFASGCTALTGVEAISDGVPAFKAPEWKNARRTLAWMGSLLAIMFVGLTLAASNLGIRAFASTVHPLCVSSKGACTYQSVIAQVTARAWGGSGFLFSLMAVATTLILILAANTSFSDFPRLLYFLARDEYAPHQFGRTGDRLAYSNGIVVLGALAILLVIGFDARVDALIPLYAVGVFLAFTMSQMGMVVRWIKRKEAGWKRALPLNGIGMTLTATVFVIFGSTKFLEGAWVVLLIIPAQVALYLAIHRHYAGTRLELTEENPQTPGEVKMTCIVPLSELNRVTLQTLAFARSMSGTVIAVHVCDNDLHIRKLQEEFMEWGNHVPLEILRSPYRTLIRPIRAYIDAIDKQQVNDTIVVLLPEVVAPGWWAQLLHNQSVLRLKAVLLLRPGTVVVSVPFHLRRHGKKPGSGQTHPGQHW